MDGILHWEMGRRYARCRELRFYGEELARSARPYTQRGHASYRTLPPDGSRTPGVRSHNQRPEDLHEACQIHTKGDARSRPGSSRILLHGEREGHPTLPIDPGGMAHSLIYGVGEYAVQAEGCEEQ